MYELLKRILVDELQVPADDIRPEATRDEAGLDSLTMVELSMVLEKRFGIEISDDELIDLKTVGKIADLMAARHAGDLAPDAQVR